MALGLDHFQDVFPVFQAQVDAGRVVAAGVQHDDRAGRQGVQVFEHASAVDIMARRVVVAVVLYREAGGLEQGAVVFPARVADGHYGIGRQALEEVGADLQGAGTTDSLHSHDTACGQQGRFCTEDQLLHGLVVGGDTVDRQVAAGGVLGDALRLGFDHRAQQRNAAFLIAVDAHAKVDLVGTWIGVECFVEAQNRVAGCQLDSGKQAHCYLGSEWRVIGRTRSSRMH
ncbi:hypothetical protein D3C76_1173450 [compost metagenome]